MSGGESRVEGVTLRLGWILAKVTGRMLTAPPRATVPMRKGFPTYSQFVLIGRPTFIPTTPVAATYTGISTQFQSITSIHLFIYVNMVLTCLHHPHSITRNTCNVYVHMTSSEYGV